VSDAVGESGAVCEGLRHGAELVLELTCEDLAAEARREHPCGTSKTRTYVDDPGPRPVETTAKGRRLEHFRVAAVVVLVEGSQIG
jgi:hypothetical protein